MNDGIGDYVGRHLTHEETFGFLSPEYHDEIIERSRRESIDIDFDRVEPYILSETIRKDGIMNKSFSIPPKGHAFPCVFFLYGRPTLDGETIPPGTLISAYSTRYVKCGSQDFEPDGAGGSLLDAFPIHDGVFIEGGPTRGEGVILAIGDIEVLPVLNDDPYPGDRLKYAYGFGEWVEVIGFNRAPEPSNPRDLNGDGIVDEKELEILNGCYHFGDRFPYSMYLRRMIDLVSQETDTDREDVESMSRIEILANAGPIVFRGIK